MKVTITKVNTTVGPRYIVVSRTQSKEFKTLKGAENWVQKKGATVLERTDITGEEIIKF